MRLANTTEDGLAINTRLIGAVLFDLDGVIASTARVHRDAWRRALAEVIRGDRLTDEEYRTHIDGKARMEGARSILEARGADTAIAGRLARIKNELFGQALDASPPEPLPGAESLLALLREQGVRTGLFTASRNGRRVLEALPPAIRFDTVIDGETAAYGGLASKPAPDLPLAAADRLGADPDRCILFEDAVAGVQAGKRGGFGLVVGIGEGRHANVLKEAGADAVVPSLAKLTLR